MNLYARITNISLILDSLDSWNQCATTFHSGLLCITVVLHFICLIIEGSHRPLDSYNMDQEVKRAQEELDRALKQVEERLKTTTEQSKLVNNELCDLTRQFECE